MLGFTFLLWLIAVVTSWPTPSMSSVSKGLFSRSFFFDVLVDDTDFHIISAEPERHLSKVIRAETDEVDMFR